MVMYVWSLIRIPASWEEIACNEELGLAEDCCIQRLEVASDCLIVLENIKEMIR